MRRLNKCALPGDMLVIDRTKQRVQSLVAAMLGALLTGLVVYVNAEAKDVAVGDSLAVVKGCKLPDGNGAMTVYVMEGEKLRCWRWK